MTQRRKDLLMLFAMLVLLVLFFAKILFTHQIIRAPDIINEFYWWAKAQGSNSFWDIFKVKIFYANWDIIINSGNTDEGGSLTSQFLFNRNLIFTLLPAPANVAWYIVLQLFFGAAGTYCYCRMIGTSRLAALLGGLTFALATENASLINAGHVMKIATISFAPWAFYCFEKGFLTRRVYWFLATGFVLAFQFFNIHWQIAYYTCLGIGVYGVMRSVGIVLAERREGKRLWGRLFCLNLITLCFFLSTVSISLIPLANWSKGTNRGVESGASQGKGGLDRDEAMSWSMPPEEVTSFVIPGFFGYSRQEAGENPSNIASYYWGRMNFTQTLSYMGLLPWLLLPLPLIFRRDRYTWLAVAAVAGGVLFSMGKFTPFYNFLFDHFPGINRFRVPKMMMFLPVLGLGVLAARGIDLLRDETIRKSRAFGNYLWGLGVFPLLLLVLLGAEILGKNVWLRAFYEMLAQPTRYEQGPQLVAQRWDNLVQETAIAAGLAALVAGAVIVGCRKRLPALALPVVLIVLYLADVGRVNAKFMFLVDEPQKSKGVETPDIAFLKKMPNQYRVLPMGPDPAQYASAGIPVMFVSNPVQQRRWQEYLDSFNLGSSMPDILNVKYLIFTAAEFQAQQSQLEPKYTPVMSSPDGQTVVVENRTVLPKAWLVPSAVQVNSAQETLAVLRDPRFNPRLLGLVESPNPIALDAPTVTQSSLPGEVRVLSYAGERIELDAVAAKNSLLILGEKFYRGWRAQVDGKETEIYPVDHVLRGIYLTPGRHRVEFFFDPVPFKIGKYLFLVSLALFAAMSWREWAGRKRRRIEAAPDGCA